jgi:hypothetical protein
MSNFFNRTTFFWAVNIVFMMISAYHAAPFFGSVVSTTPGLEKFAPYIGLPVALILDGITIVFMQARLEAVYKRDNRKAKEYLWYVFMASGLSTIANLYTDIEHFQMASYTHLWPLMQGLAPVVLSIFPLFLVAISKAADELVSGTSLDKLDVEEFEMLEERRLKLLEIQSLSMQREALIIQQIINAEAQQKRNDLLRKRIESGKVKVTELGQSSGTPMFTSSYPQSALQAPAGVEETHLEENFEETETDTNEDQKVNEEVYSEVNAQVNRDCVRKVIPMQRSVNSEATKQILKLLKKHPEMGPSELARRTGITKGYASRIRTQFFKDQGEGA